VLALECVDRGCGARPGDPVDLRKVETVRAEGDLQTRDLRISGSVNRRGGRQRTGETDERNAAAHESDQFCPGGVVPPSTRNDEHTARRAPYRAGMTTESFASEQDPGRSVLDGLTDQLSRVLGSFEVVLYASVGLLLAAAGILVLVGTTSGLFREVRDGAGAVNVAVLVLDRVLLALIVGELLYTLRFVVRTHEIAVEPFLYIGLIAVVRRILIVTAQLERGTPSGRALTNILLEFGTLGLLVPALAAAVFLVSRSRLRAARA
jgi:uncharacterized membrane protein (DUF373 family)